MISFLIVMIIIYEYFIVVNIHLTKIYYESTSNEDFLFHMWLGLN